MKKGYPLLIMNLSELKRIEKLPHLSDFSAEQLITELSLYERVLITTDDVKFVDATYDNEIPYVSVSKDVKALHEFCLSEKRIVLPCSHCHSDRPFEQSKGWNPRKVNISKKVDHKYTLSEVSVNSASSTDEKRKDITCLVQIIALAQNVLIILTSPIFRISLGIYTLLSVVINAKWEF